ncbi:polycystic kidney disease protein 1-like 3 [Epinephelus moara]|uniref:polycystic kidney disease protein 1-like 3 n=1 Tax=Epinephelus moara TaxID=300413 RepID=UPI00214F4701|nr:polycystic kidney disease protein 1-like 3 [Epinephelus moara]XP_049918097.1 polycystic kidney disease protein 1-like 3 [Epinephelus moara]XP_049918098.1 polycystic kidney disease protein 1-like 3 [Epinephelus moara]
MSFASDRLYNEYVRRKMPTFVDKVDVGEIIYHLPCLTAHDREHIEARRQNRGNREGVVMLLDCLKRRENWPEQFIEALEACEQCTLAAEMRAKYNTLRGIRQAAVAPPAEVSAPPEPAEASAPPEPAEASAPPEPAEASAPPEPAAQASPPVQPQAPQSSAAQVPEAVSPPEPVPEPPQSTQAEVAPPPSTPPPSPATPHTQPTTPPPPQRKTNSHQEPVENSESDIQDVSADDVVIPDQVSAGNREVSISSVDAPQPSHPVEQCETDTASPDPLQTTTTSTEVSPPQSPSAAQMNSDVTDGSSFLTLTPERPPVQDTSPPGDFKAVLQPEETSEPPAAQVVESSPQTEAAATTSPPPGAAGMGAPLCDDSSVCLSKPGPLISVHPLNHSSPTIPAQSLPVPPYSGNSERLEISSSVSDAVTTAQSSTCSYVSSTTVTTASAPPCQETGITLNHNEPEENHYESPRNSLGMQSVQEHVGHVSEEPSILNLDGQNLTPQVPAVGSEAAKEMTSAPPLSNTAADTVPSVNTSCSENHHPSEPTPTDLSAEQKTLQDSEEKMACRTLTPNTKYILIAAGVGACALLMAWRFKH